MNLRSYNKFEIKNIKFFFFNIKEIYCNKIKKKNILYNEFRN